MVSETERQQVAAEQLVHATRGSSKQNSVSVAKTTKGMQDLWLVEGKFYDFEAFVPKHPGGASYITLGKGRDCTELFKSVHQISNVNFEALFAKYQVQPEFEYKPDALIEFDWSDKSTFQKELRDEVKKYFADRKMSHKATTSFWVFFGVYSFVMMYFLFKTITVRSYFNSVVAGMMLMSWGFGIMHTGSHGGLSENSFVNWFLFATFCNCMGWFHHLWLQHHVYGHHSYTGLYGRDPDVTNLPAEWCRKNTKQEFRPQHKYNSYIEMFVLTILPSQFLAQGLDYFGSLWKKNLFGMDVIHVLTPVDAALTLFQVAIWFTTFVITPIYSTGFGHMKYIFALYSTLGIFYWAFVETNHDVIEVQKASDEIGGKSKDWAIHQIVHSANFKAPALLTFLIGGMNYQIEHHLFPSVHPSHYPAIAKIVQKLCAKYKVSYVMHKTWFHATWAHIKFMNFMANPKNAAKSS
jgi:linoleoyl-CoA desaturase